MLSGVSWATLPRIFTSATLSHENCDNVEQHLSMCIVVWNLLGNIAQCFYLCNVVPGVLRQHWTKFFQCNVVWSLLDNMTQGFFSYFVKCCPKKVKTALKKIFLVLCWLQLQGQRYIGFFLWNIAPKILIQHCTGFFSVKFYLQPLGQHRTRCVSVQCCPKSITTTLNRICPVQCCLEPLGHHS